MNDEIGDASSGRGSLSFFSLSFSFSRVSTALKKPWLRQGLLPNPAVASLPKRSRIPWLQKTNRFAKPFPGEKQTSKCHHPSPTNLQIRISRQDAATGLSQRHHESTKDFSARFARHVRCPISNSGLHVTKDEKRRQGVSRTRWQCCQS